MPYKSSADRTRVKRDWKYTQVKAVELIRTRAQERGEDPEGLTEKTIPKELLAEVRAEVRELIKDGAIPPPEPVKPEYNKKRPFPRLPPALPMDALTISLEDPKQMPPDLKRYGHSLLTAFFQELQVLGDVQIVALKNGLPLHVILRRCQEGEVDQREDRDTWNAALYRKVAQARAHVMATDLAVIRSKMTKGDVDNPVPHNIQLRAATEHARFTFPERFLPGRSVPDILFSPRVGVQVNNGPAPIPGPAPTADPKNAIGAPQVVAPSQEDLDDMSDISLAELELALKALEQGKLE